MASLTVFTPKILVVNDHLPTLLAMEALLNHSPQRTSFEVIIAQSGEEALGKVLQHDFAVIILDAKMPTMDGFETAKTIRSRPRCASIPIIFVTAHYDDEVSRLKGYATGAVDFLLTPIIPEILIGKVTVFVELQRQSHALAEMNDHLRTTLNAIGDAVGDAVITLNSDGCITYLNPVAVNMTGWRNGEAAGQPLTTAFRIFHDRTGEPAADPAKLALSHGQIYVPEGDFVLEDRDGRRTCIELSSAPIRDQEDAVIGAVLVFRDVTHARQMAEKMTYQASHDALTGLINRREFEYRLEQAVETGEVQGKEHTLLYLDLDQFKIVNDTCGHGAGDQLLRRLTNLLEAQLRQSDTLGRLGGDEFGVLLDGCGAKAAINIAEKLQQTVSEFRFIWLDKTFTVGVSIGLVTFSRGESTLADLLRMADAACYAAKDHGRNRIHVYTPEDKELAQRKDEMGWVGRIHRVLEERRFVLYSQKILPLGENSHGDEQHHELLLRMLDSDGSIVPPMAFIPAAERYNLMPTIDRWVIHEALSRYAELAPERAAHGTFAINLSGASICDEHMLEFIREQFRSFKVPPEKICFEITETAAIANLTQAVQLIRALKELGCRIALDDFGSGMSSFTYLKHLEVDYLKIDGSFVKDMVKNPVDYATVEAINRIGHVMGIRTIAEYVEDDKILRALRELNVDFAQGYGVEKPHEAWRVVSVLDESEDISIKKCVAKHTG